MMTLQTGLGIVINDWLTNAANEIYIGTALSSCNIRDIIAKHCPFKPDLAYEEVGGGAIIKLPPMPVISDFTSDGHVSSAYWDALRVWKEVALAIAQGPPSAPPNRVIREGDNGPKEIS